MGGYLWDRDMKCVRDNFITMQMCKTELRGKEFNIFPDIKLIFRLQFLYIRSNAFVQDQFQEMHLLSFEELNKCTRQFCY